MREWFIKGVKIGSIFLNLETMELEFWSIFGENTALFSVDFTIED